MTIIFNCINVLNNVSIEDILKQQINAGDAIFIQPCSLITGTICEILVFYGIK